MILYTCRIRETASFVQARYVIEIGFENACLLRFFFIQFNYVYYVDTYSGHKMRIILSKIKLEISARNSAIKLIKKKLDNYNITLYL